MPSSDRTYWAQKTGLDLAEVAYKRVRRFYTDLIRTTMWRRWVKSYRVVYGLSGMDDPFDVSRAMATGDEGELTAVKINHAGSLLRRAVALVSQTVPEFEPVPINTDSKSLEQVDFAKNLLNWCMDSRGVAAKLYKTSLAAGIFGLAWLSPEWDPRLGEPLKSPDPAIPQKTKTGDLSFTVYDPLDVVVNRFRYDQDHDWLITRKWQNRYELAARYPTLADEIIDFRPDMRRDQSVTTNSIEAERGLIANEDAQELIPLWTLYHRRCDAVPDGKIAFFLSDNILLYEGGLPYRDVPMIPICPGEFLRTPHGDAPLHHVLGLQDLYDNIASAVATNNVAFATQVIVVPSEADYSYNEVAKGLSILRCTTGPDGKSKPEGLNLSAPNAEALRFLELIKLEMETIYGISSTLRGTPQANIQSGAFAALVAQQALEYAGAFQYSFQQAVSRTGNAIVQLLKQYATEPLVAEIAGKSKAYEVRSFTSKDLDQIDRIVVRSGNPAARTAQFAIAAADSLLAKGLINKNEYLSLQRTGQLETVVDTAEAEQMNIRRENEFLSVGKVPPVVATDQHRDHIQRHAQQIGDPGVRENPIAVQAGLAHIQAHIDALRQTDPALLMLLGQTPLPPTPGGSPSPTGTPPAPPGPPGAQGAQARPDPLPPPPPGGPLPEQPTLPSMPTNPLTNAPWTPQDGAIQQ